LREYAGLTRDGVVRSGTRFELWDEALWVAQREASIKLNQGGQELSPELSAIAL
jgi:DNA-binding transcriptional regulator/RsmH inhibitor MraZ